MLRAALTTGYSAPLIPPGHERRRPDNVVGHKRSAPMHAWRRYRVCDYQLDSKPTADSREPTALVRVPIRLGDRADFDLGVDIVASGRYSLSIEFEQLLVLDCLFQDRDG